MQRESQREREKKADCKQSGGVKYINTHTYIQVYIHICKYTYTCTCAFTYSFIYI